MFKKLLLAAALTFVSLGGAWAQNVNCATRPPGDNSNACASTAFVNQNSQSVISILAYNGKGDNTTDNSPALVKALAANPCATIYFPAPGKYRFNSAVTQQMPSRACSLTLQGGGQGQGGTVLNWANNTAGLSFTWMNEENSIHIRDMTISTSHGGTNTGVSIINSTVFSGFQEATINDITNVTFQGDTGLDATKYWGTAVYVQAISNVVFNSDLFYGGLSGTTPVGRGAVLTDFTGVITANLTSRIASLPFSIAAS